MKQTILKNTLVTGIMATGIFAFIASCNKPLLAPNPIIVPAQGTQTALEFITADTTYSYFLAAVTRATPASGTPTLLATLGDKTTFSTFYAPNNAAFRASGIPSIAVINSAFFTTGKLDSLFRYHIIPGEQWTSVNVPTAFPNIQLPSLLTLGPLPGTPLPFRLSLYPSKGTNGFWINNVPITSADKILINGVLHTPAVLVSPPSMLLGWANAPGVLSDPQYSLFDSVIVKADQGALPTSTTSFTYALNIPFANLTVFAPTNTAVKAYLITVGFPPGLPDAAYAALIRTNLPQDLAKGIVAYSILPTKAFTVNFPTTPTVFPTLVPTASIPGVRVQAFFTGPVVDSLKVLGLPPGNGGVPATSKPTSPFDKNAVNGVVHTIDKVLSPI